MASAFEREIGAVAASCGMSPRDTVDVLRSYRREAARFADTAAKIGTVDAARRFADYVLPNTLLTGSDCVGVVGLFKAMRGIDREEGSARDSVFADLTDDESFFAQAKRRAGLPPSFTLDIPTIQRLRGLV